MDTLVDRGWHELDGDKRTISHLLCDQLEYADLLLINNCDLVTAAQRDAVDPGFRITPGTASPFLAGALRHVFFRIFRPF